MDGSAEYSMHEEVTRIFHQVLLLDHRLGLPQKVVDIVSSTTFDGATTTIASPFIPAPLKFTESSAALWALAATFGNAIVKERFGIEQQVVVNIDVASLFLASSALCRVDGKSILDPGLSARYIKYDLGHMSQLWRRLCTNVYPTKDGRFFHLHGSMNADRSLAMLGLPKDRPDLTSVDEVVREYTRSTSQLDSEWLDIESNEHWRQAGTICLSPDEFRASEQGKAISSDPLYLVKQSATDVLPPVPYATARQDGAATNKYRPLEGIKMIDISRVIAAPTIAKLAALFGATVVRVSCDSQPDMGPLLIDGNLGKYDVSLDLKSAAGRAALRDLVDGADIVLDGYRPGALERLGFGVDYLHFIARQRGRGIVVIRENCYGWHGPWAQRSGWQQISDCVTGVSWLMGKFLGLDEPVVPPLPNSDYQTGVAGLIGLLTAIDKRAHEGGNYVVDVSLNQFNQFLLSLGEYSPEVQKSLRDLHPNFQPRHYDDMTSLVGKVMVSLQSQVPKLFQPSYFDNIESNFGKADGGGEILTYLRPAATYEKTNLGYDVGSCLLGAYEPVWPQTSQ